MPDQRRIRTAHPRSPQGRGTEDEATRTATGIHVRLRGRPRAGRRGHGRHHTVAVVKSDDPGLHHTSWEFSSFQDFKGLADALLPEDRKLIWGPGRHGAGDNLFLYFKNSADFLIECTAEMELIHDDYAAPRIVEPGENLSNYKVVNQWGALPPIEWIDHHTGLAPESAHSA